jgi:hypothetical protein
MFAPLWRSEPAEAPTSTPVNSDIDCQNLGCRLAGGNRTRGSQQCVEFKCKRCCQSAADGSDRHMPARGGPRSGLRTGPSVSVVHVEVH